MCGHNGEPGTDPAPVNHVRLKLVDSGEVIAKEIPPRNDTAVQYKWDLKKWAGKRAVFEAVDADTKPGYAWIGVGRFEPAVLVNPTRDFSFSDVALATAIQVADQLRLEKYAAAIVELLKGSHSDQTVRVAAAKAGLNLSRTATIESLAAIVQNSDESNGLRTQAAQMLGAVNSPLSRESLAGALRTAPGPLQQPIALALAGSRDGGELLFNLVGSGRASARLLQDKPVLDRLAAASIPDREKRIEELTQGIPDADERLRKAIAKYSTRLAGAQADANAGAALFKKSCSACHRISDHGGKVGPQLDGIGIRGLERLLEDVLDPNRNVDGAFRATVVETKNGLIVTGLKLREEGTTLILGDNQGKEIRIPAEEIEEQRLSNLSPMPSNFSEQLNEEDLGSLIAYLLQQRQPVKKPEGGEPAR
jgi:putative heme-binding domain-containing protein